MKKLLIILPILCLSCGRNNYVTFGGIEQGTTWRMVVRNPDDGLAARIDAVFDTVDNTFSIFNPASLVSRINRGLTDVVTPLFEECFAIARDVHDSSNGYYDITVKPLVDAWGFGPGEQQEIPCVKCLMEYVGMEKVRIDSGRIVKDDARVQLDFGSVAKGFTVDLLAELLESEGARHYLIDIGGEIRASGVNAEGRPWRVGIYKPDLESMREHQAIVEPSRELPSIATSANTYQQFADEFGRIRVHTVDPTTGYPAQGNVISVSIAAAECGIADAWATALMAAHDISKVREILPPTGIEYYITYSDTDGAMTSLQSSGFPTK
jgi:thiamine biosynthesis lipoprotein